jgi:hypothetical protein
MQRNQQLKNFIRHLRLGIVKSTATLGDSKKYAKVSFDERKWRVSEAVQNDNLIEIADALAIWCTSFVGL